MLPKMEGPVSTQNSANLFYQTWPKAQQKIAQSQAVLVLLGSVEQHGLHLPLGTDTLLAEAVAQALCHRLALCYYPCITFGEVWSARDFPGTVSITPQVLKEYIKNIATSLKRFGPKRIVFYSFHNGNLPTIKQTVRELRDESHTQNIFSISLPDLHRKSAQVLTSPVWEGKVWHAGELETSLMLHIAPQLVHMELATCEFPQKPTGYDYGAIPWKNFIKSGAFGDATAATPEKGQQLFTVLIQELENQLYEIFTIEGEGD